MPRHYSFMAISMCLLISLLAACGGIIGTTPEASSPVLEMLDKLPASAQDEPSGVNLVDYEAALAASGLEPISSEQAQNDAVLIDWFTAVSGTRSDLALLTRAAEYEAMQAAVGFTLFDIRREATFGQPPAPGVVLEGEFDSGKIEAALADRGFTAEQVAGVEVWCGPAGCDEGLNVNVENRQPANPFGGSMGRQEPLYVSDSLLMNSADVSRLAEMVEAYQGNESSLADNPDYRALAEASSSLGTVIQMRLMPPDDYWITLDATDILGERATEEAAAAVSDIFAEYGTLPEYSLWGIADIWDGEQQIAALLLVMESSDDAQAAAQEIDTRLSSSVLPLLNLTFAEAAAERGGALAPASIYESGDLAVVIAVVTYPQPAPPAEGEMAEPPGMVYRLLSDLWLRRHIDLFLARDFDI